MPILAIAGGTSASLGRAIVTAILPAPHLSSWQIVLLSRSPKIPLWLRAVDPNSRRCSIKVVDYASIESIVHALHKVDTLVSVVSAVDGTQAQVQINLVNAAIEAGCRRFAPSQWGMGFKSYQSGLMKSMNEGVWEECLKHEGKIECGRFNNGMFMNYLGHGVFFPKPQEVDEETKLQALVDGHGYSAGADDAIQGLSPEGDLKDGSGGFLVSLASGIAALPVREDGGWPRFSTTTLRDTGRFVAASLELPKWEHDMSMSGDTITMDELLEIAEEVSGKRIEIEKITPKDLEKQHSELAPDDFFAQAWLEFKIMYGKDEEDLAIMRPVLNNLLPEVKPTSVREYLVKAWASSQMGN